MGKKFGDTVPIPCSARIAPPSPELLASPFLASIFAGAISYLKITMLHTHVYFFLPGPPAHCMRKRQRWESEPPGARRAAAISHPSARYPAPLGAGAHSQGSLLLLHHSCLSSGHGLENTHDFPALHQNNSNCNKKEVSDKKG